MNFKEFLKNLSDYYREIPSLIYTDILYKELRDLTNNQLDTLFYDILHTVDRKFKCLPGITDIKAIFESYEKDKDIDFDKLLLDNQVQMIK